MSCSRSPCVYSAGLLLRLLVSELCVEDRDIFAGTNTSPWGRGRLLRPAHTLTERTLLLLSRRCCEVGALIHEELPRLELWEM